MPEPTNDPPPKPAHATRQVDSRELLNGDRELVIVHGAERYRLLLTNQNKLILTK